MISVRVLRAGCIAAAAAALLAACGGQAGNAASPSPAAASAKPPASTVASAASAKPSASNAPSSAASAAPSQQLTPMKIGYLSPSAGSATSWIAKGAGFFANHGIDADLQYLSAATLTKAVIAGSLDVGQGSSANAASAVAAGADLVMIACNEQAPIYSIVARKGITNIKDLRGKQVSGGAQSSTGDLLLRQLMQDQGMKAGQDYGVVPFPEYTGAIAALIQGQIDAAVMTEPGTSIAIAQGFPMIYDQKATGVQNVGGPFLVTKTYLAGHQDLLKRFLMAELEAVHLLKTDAGKAGGYANKLMQLDDEKVAVAAIQHEGELMDGYMSVPLASLASQMQVAAASEPKVGQLKAQDLVDTSLLDGIVGSGFVSKLYDGKPPARSQ